MNCQSRKPKQNKHVPCQPDQTMTAEEIRNHHSMNALFGQPFVSGSLRCNVMIPDLALLFTAQPFILMNILQRVIYEVHLDLLKLSIVWLYNWFGK